MDHVAHLLNRQNLHCHLGSLLIGFPVADFITLYGSVPSTLPIFSQPLAFLLLSLAWYVSFSVVHSN